MTFRDSFGFLAGFVPLFADDVIISTAILPHMNLLVLADWSTFNSKFNSLANIRKKLALCKRVKIEIWEIPIACSRVLIKEILQHAQKFLDMEAIHHLIKMDD